MNASEEKIKLSEPFEHLLRVLFRNGFVMTKDIDPTKGKSSDNPIMIDFVEDYVWLEYRVVEFLLNGQQFKFLHQTLYNRNDRHLDLLEYEITEEDGSTRQESFWFDITVGYETLWEKES